MLIKTLHSGLRSKLEEMKRRWRRSTTQGKIIMCVFNYFVLGLLAFSMLTCVAIPSLNYCFLPFFLLTACYVTFYRLPEEPLMEPEESPGMFIVKRIATIIFGIFFVIGICIAL